MAEPSQDNRYPQWILMPGSPAPFEGISPSRREERSNKPFGEASLLSSPEGTNRFDLSGREYQNE